MRIIILAAGNSKRFQEAGYKTPKPFLLIKWRGHIDTMLGHVLHSVPLGFPISVAVPAGLEPTPTSEEEVKIKEISKTIGPAHTLQQMLERDEKSLLVLDVDIINNTNDLLTLTWLNTSAVLVSKSTNPAFSYVTNLGSFYKIKEKERISPYAVRGAYFISQNDVSMFRQCLDDVISSRQEPFISHALDMMPSPKFALETTYNPIEWGTPLDFQTTDAEIIGELECTSSMQ